MCDYDRYPPTQRITEQKVPLFALQPDKAAINGTKSSVIRAETTLPAKKQGNNGNFASAIALFFALYEE